MTIEHLKYGWWDWGPKLLILCNVIHLNAYLNSHICLEATIYNKAMLEDEYEEAEGDLCYQGSFHQEGFYLTLW